MAVTQGTLTEHNLAIGTPSIETEIGAGSAYSFGPDHIHRLTGRDPGSVSVHAYSPPLWRMGQYTWAPAGSCGGGRCPTPTSCGRWTTWPERAGGTAATLSTGTRVQDQLVLDDPYDPLIARAIGRSRRPAAAAPSRPGIRTAWRSMPVPRKVRFA